MGKRNGNYRHGERTTDAVARRRSLRVVLQSASEALARPLGKLARAKRARERLGTSPAHRSLARWGACTIWQLQQTCQHLDRE